MMLTNHELQELIKLVSSSPIRKFEFSDESKKILIEKEGSICQASQQSESGFISTTFELPLLDNKENEGITSGLLEITSPMVGTFYSAPGKGAASFAQIGDRVGPDTVVCVLEAMKLFTEVTAKVSGEIVKVLIKDGELVEYGQPMFLVKPVTSHA